MYVHVLIIDDDVAVLSGLRRAFALADYEVTCAQDGEEGLALANEINPDLVVLDVVLPGLDGFSVCERLRNQFPTPVPILMLSARDAVPDRVAGLDRGADDYLVKPFSIDELLARARALSRRGQAGNESKLTFADLSIDLAARECFQNGQLIALTPHEFDLLETFLRHPKQALSRDQLCQHVWGFAFEGESNFVDVAVMDLRKKLETGGKPRLIQTVRGHGYILREG
jgi:two-component system, OmpR family, response regulator MprA